MLPVDINDGFTFFIINQFLSADVKYTIPSTIPYGVLLVIIINGSNERATSLRNISSSLFPFAFIIPLSYTYLLASFLTIKNTFPVSIDGLHYSHKGPFRLLGTGGKPLVFDLFVSLLNCPVVTNKPLCVSSAILFPRRSWINVCVMGHSPSAV